MLEHPAESSAPPPRHHHHHLGTPPPFPLPHLASIAGHNASFPPVLLAYLGTSLPCPVLAGTKNCRLKKLSLGTVQSCSINSCLWVDAGPKTPETHLLCWVVQTTHPQVLFFLERGAVCCAGQLRRTLALRHYKEHVPNTCLPLDILLLVIFCTASSEVGAFSMHAAPVRNTGSSGRLGAGGLSFFPFLFRFFANL